MSRQTSNNNKNNNNNQKQQSMIDSDCIQFCGQHDEYAALLATLQGLVLNTYAFGGNRYIIGDDPDFIRPPAEIEALAIDRNKLVSDIIEKLQQEALAKASISLDKILVASPHYLYSGEYSAAVMVIPWPAWSWREVDDGIELDAGNGEVVFNRILQFNE